PGIRRRRRTRSGRRNSGTATAFPRRTADTRPAARPRTPRSSAARTRRPGRRRPSRRGSYAAPPAASSGPCSRTDCTARPIVRVWADGDRPGSRACRLAAGSQGGRSPPRGSPDDLPQHADHPGDRGARPHPLQAGQDPRLVLHRPRERGRCHRRRHGVVVDGTDRPALPRESRGAIAKARAGGGPTLIEPLTLRMEGPAVHDDAFYVPKDMFERWAANDQIERFRSWVRDNAELSDSEEEEIGASVKKLLNDALQRAEESPLPDPSSLLDGVFATPEDLDTPHHK